MGMFSRVRDQLNSGWKRTERARAIAQVPVMLFGPSADQVAQRAHLMPVQTPTEIRQEHIQEQHEQYAHESLKDAKERAGQLVHDRQPEPEKDRTGSKARPDRANLGRTPSRTGSRPRARER
jgi:hypothetical protein